MIPRFLAVAVLLGFGAAAALAQGLGGIYYITPTSGVPCAANFVFDWSVATGCDAITAVIR